jgi:membrane protein DedA with SNARE-associated domain
MIESFLLWIESIILPYGAWGIFVASILEEVIVPIPSTLVQMGGGFILMEGFPVSPSNLARLFFLVVLPATIGLTIGSLFAFFIGRYGAEPVLSRIGRYIGISWSDIVSSAKTMEAKGNVFWILVLVRSLPIMPAAVASAAAGLLQFRIIPYIVATFLGTIIRASVLGFVGWRLGAEYTTIAPYIERFEKVGFIIFVGLIFVWWIRRRRPNTHP